MTNSELRPEHKEIIDNFVLSTQNQKAEYMLTISRDGEFPARSIYFFNDALVAAKAYERYSDWGFAKEYLTVALYQPNGIVSRKILKRPPAGECVFIKNDYIEAENIILSVKDKMDKESYSNLVKQFALLFSRDNIRFNASRFFEKTECKEVNE